MHSGNRLPNQQLIKSRKMLVRLFVFKLTGKRAHDGNMSGTLSRIIAIVIGTVPIYDLRFHCQQH